MQLKLLSSVCAIALGLAFAPAAWADGFVDELVRAGALGVREDGVVVDVG